MADPDTHGLNSEAEKEAESTVKKLLQDVVGTFIHLEERNAKKLLTLILASVSVATLRIPVELLYDLTEDVVSRDQSDFPNAARALARMIDIPDELAEDIHSYLKARHEMILGNIEPGNPSPSVEDIGKWL